MQGQQNNLTHPPAPLEVCVIVGSDFGYPTTVRIRLEGNEGELMRDNIVNIEYVQWMPFCLHCRGYGHWTQKCRRSENKDRGEWNKSITVVPPPVNAGKPITGNARKTQKTNPRQNQNPKNRRRRYVPDHIPDVGSEWNIELSAQNTRSTKDLPKSNK